MAKNNTERFVELATRLRSEFGSEAGAVIIKIIYEELGGLRIVVPTISQITIQERNRWIRARFTGFNHGYLAAAWGISERQVRRIVNR